jgi:group II intron reverse transcriptase/maturase
MKEVSTEKKIKVHSLIDKVYSLTNLKIAWEKVKANKGAGGIDKETIETFEKVADEQIKTLHEELKTQSYEPTPVMRVYIPKPGKPNEKRPLGIPIIKDRILQQALKNRMEPIFEQKFSDSSFGYRPGRSPHDAMRKIWKEIMVGYHWIVDADLRDFFGTVNHEKVTEMVAEEISDGRVLSLIRLILEAGYVEKGKRYSTPKGTPQGGVISPLLSNIYLTPFDHAMTEQGYKLTRWADDWVILCKTRKEAEIVLNKAKEILSKLGLILHPEKTKIVHISWGFEFLGYKIKQGKGLRLPKKKLKKHPNAINVYAFPRDKSVKKFMDQIRARTKRKIPLTLKEIIDEINPIIRGWGNYYRKAHVRKLFNKLDRWIIRRLWNHQFKKWRNAGWKKYPAKLLYEKFKLVNLVQLIPGLR